MPQLSLFGPLLALWINTQSLPAYRSVRPSIAHLLGSLLHSTGLFSAATTANQANNKRNEQPKHFPECSAWLDHVTNMERARFFELAVCAAVANPHSFVHTQADGQDKRTNTPVMVCARALCAREGVGLSMSGSVLSSLDLSDMEQFVSAVAQQADPHSASKDDASLIKSLSRAIGESLGRGHHVVACQ